MINNPNTKQTIFKKLRANLNNAAPQKERVQSVNNLPTTPIATYQPANLISSKQQLVNEFKVRLENQSTKVYLVESKTKIPEILAGILPQYSHSQILYAGKDQKINTLDWQEEGIELNEGTPSENGAVSISHSFAGAAETGTLFFTSGPENPARNNYLSTTHIALIHEDTIVQTYEEAFAIQSSMQADLPRSLMMISGPSRTADIEQTLILGAHGPTELIVIIYRA